MSIHCKVAADQTRHILQSLFSCYYIRCELLVQKCSCCCKMIHLSARFDNCCRSVYIGWFLRWDTFWYRDVSLSSVSSCSDYFSKVYVACCRKHIYSVLSASHSRTSCDQIMIQVEYILHDRICIVIVITIFWSLIMYHTEDCIITFKVVIHCFKQFFHCEILLVKYVIFYSCDTVCNSSDTYTLDIVGVVSCSTCIVIFCIADTVICNNWQTRCRHILSIQFLDHVVSTNLDIDDIF